MTRQLAPITLAFLIALASTPMAQAKQSCSAAMPSNPQGHWWSYRLIDGRKCWYEGKPGLSKALLEWTKEASAQPAPDKEMRNTAPPEKPRTPLDSQAWAPISRARAPTDSSTFETRWHDRAVIDEARALPTAAAPVTNARPTTREDDDGPHLGKADKLQSSYLDSSQVKAVRTLVIIPDPPQPAFRSK